MAGDRGPWLGKGQLGGDMRTGSLRVPGSLRGVRNVRGLGCATPPRDNVPPSRRGYSATTLRKRTVDRTKSIDVILQTGAAPLSVRDAHVARDCSTANTVDRA